jgi:hypothetical protein
MHFWHCRQYKLISCLSAASLRSSISWSLNFRSLSNSRFFRSSSTEDIPEMMLEMCGFWSTHFRAALELNGRVHPIDIGALPP